MNRRNQDGLPRPPRAVTSLQNEQIKAVRALAMRKARRQTGLFVVEGASVILSARDRGWSPRMLIYAASEKHSATTAELISWAAEAGAECLEVNAAVLAKLATKENPQSVLAVFEQRWASPPDPGSEPPYGTWLALEHVRDPGNLGTIIRTADAVGARGIILVGATCDPYSPEATRATMGSVFSVPLVRLEAGAFLAWVAMWTGDVVGTHLSATKDFRSASYRGPVLLVMGSEGAGLSDETAAACNTLVKIPMAGDLDSLNLAVATALTLYEIRRAHLHI